MMESKDIKMVANMFKSNRDIGIKGVLIVPPERAFEAARFIKGQDNLEYIINWLGNENDNIGYGEHG